MSKRTPRTSVVETAITLRGKRKQERSRRAAWSGGQWEASVEASMVPAARSKKERSLLEGGERALTLGASCLSPPSKSCKIAGCTARKTVDERKRSAEEKKCDGDVTEENAKRRRR